MLYNTTIFLIWYNTLFGADITHITTLAADVMLYKQLFKADITCYNGPLELILLQFDCHLESVSLDTPSPATNTNEVCRGLQLILCNLIVFWNR